MKIAPSHRQKLSQLTAQRVHFRTNVEVYKDQTRQQAKESSE